MALEYLPFDFGTSSPGASIDFSQFETPQAATDVINQYAAPVTAQSVGQLYDTGGFDLSSYYPTFNFQAAAPTQGGDADISGLINRLDQVSPAPTGYGQYASLDPSQAQYALGPGQVNLGGIPFPIPRPEDAGTTGTEALYDTTGISGAGAAPQQDKAGFFQSLLGKGFSTSDALKLALGIGGGIMGMNAQKKAADEAAAAEAEYKAAAAKAAGQYSGLAQPYLTAGGSQLSMALQGALSPAQMQQFQASQAQLAQGAERTGGVGSIQSAAALQNLYQQALQNQQNMALQLLGPGNQLASNAISTELQGTQGGLKLGLDLATQANQASMNMYSAIAQMMGGQRSSTGATQ